jgi:tetratricopeptide (TPR) repeat protein
MPPFIQYWWDCRPFEPSYKIDEIKKFLSEMSFKYRDLLRWPIFEGRMMTAGIMGIVPRYRYILMTDSLMEILSIEELKAVITHEVGHARHRHMFFYVLFFLGYIGLSLGAFDIFYKFLVSQPILIGLLEGGGSRGRDLFYLILSVPIILSMFVYFRYIMGFFMRNFERQADLYSAVNMGGPAPAVSALEKIALLSGKSRNIPSWHHFSVKERVYCLWGMLKDPGLVTRHNKFVRLSFAIYLLSIAVLGYYLNFSPIKQALEYRAINNILQHQLGKDPENIYLLQNLAMTYHEMDRYSEAIDIYDRVLHLDGTQATALNNLAWLLVTAPDMELRDPKRALVLAEKAVALERSPVFLDTLAEAFYANGSTQQAIEVIREAISLEKEDDRYYKKQLEKFIDAREGM